VFVIVLIDCFALDSHDLAGSSCFKFLNVDGNVAPPISCHFSQSPPLGSAHLARLRWSWSHVSLPASVSILINF
jgi:hypothetical protein